MTKNRVLDDSKRNKDYPNLGGGSPCSLSAQVLGSLSEWWSLFANHVKTLLGDSLVNVTFAVMPLFNALIG